MGIPVGHFKNSVPKISDKIKSTLRNKLSEVKAIIVDEISIVSNKLLLYIHQRLVEIFGTSFDLPFAGLTIICSGDFYQLPPINAPPVYAPYVSGSWNNLIHMWKLFKIAELEEGMRQKEDSQLLNMLNKVRVGTLDSESENIIKSRFLSTDDPTFPKEAIHIFAENKPASCHNQGMLNQLNSPFYRIEALDEIPNNLTVSDINRALSKRQSETGGLGTILELKVGARVMLTSNIDIEDRLINGQIGTVRHITINNATKVEKIYIEFDDEKAGHKLLNNLRNIFRQRNWVPIERIEVNIKIHSSYKTDTISINVIMGCNYSQGARFKPK